MTASTPDMSVSQKSTVSTSIKAAILYATLVAGALDALDGVVFFGLKGLNPIQVLQFIASGVLGAAAFTGGLTAAGVGVLVHFSITAVIAAIYIFASQRVSVLRSQWVLCGLLYGAAVWAVMNLVVLPHTAVAHSPITLAALLNGILGHAFLIGLPISYFARKTMM